MTCESTINGLTIGRGGGGTNNTSNTVIGYLAQQGSNGVGGGNRNTVIGSLAGRYFKDGDNLLDEIQYLVDNDIKEKGEYQLKKTPSACAKGV